MLGLWELCGNNFEKFDRIWYSGIIQWINYRIIKNNVCIKLKKTIFKLCTKG